MNIKILCLCFVMAFTLTLSANNGGDSIFLPHSQVVSQVEWSPDGTKLAANLGNEVHIYDIETWQCIVVIEHWTSDIAWHPDSQLIAGVQGGDSERVLVWDANTGELVQELGRERSGDAPRVVAQPQAIDWHPDGDIIATDANMTFDESVILWNVSAENTVEAFTLVDLAGDVWHNSVHLAWSHNGEMLLSDGADDLPPNPDNYMTETKSYVLDLESGETIFSVSESAFSWKPNDEAIASVSRVDSIVRITIWDIASQQALIYFDEHTNSVVQIAWNSQSPVIASADIDNNLFIWNADTGELLELVDIDVADLRDLAWKPNSNTLAIATYEGILIQTFEFDESN